MSTQKLFSNWLNASKISILFANLILNKKQHLKLFEIALEYCPWNFFHVRNKDGSLAPGHVFSLQ